MKMDADVQKQLEDIFGVNSFPFTVKLSFAPLINRYKKQVNSPDHGVANYARTVVKKIGRSA